MPARDSRRAEIDQMILEVYPIQGPEPIMERFGLSKGAVYARANKLRILADPSRHASGTRDPKRDEIDQMIREVYPFHGYKPIAEKFGLSRTVVHTHAKLLGVKADIENKNDRARKFIADLSLWTPELTRIGAYYLGLAWTDGNVRSVSKKRYMVRFGHAGAEDRGVLDYLAKMVGAPEDWIRQGKKKKDCHQVFYTCALSGKKVTSLFINHFGIPMRKSYIDPPYPNIPDEFLASFACGVLDGDGNARLNVQNSPNPYYRFYGSRSFIETLHGKLEEQIGVEFLPVRQHSKNGSVWVFNVCDLRQTIPLTRFLYHGYYEEEGVPYFKRKHEPFKWLLTSGHFTTGGGNLVWL